VFQIGPQEIWATRPLRSKWSEGHPVMISSLAGLALAPPPTV
jgi:hypothetical protein